MIHSITKPRLPKGRSYPLRSSQLAAALAQAQIDVHVAVEFWTPRGGESVLEAHYWMPNATVSYPRVYLRAGSLPSSERLAASAALESEVLPAFVAWLEWIIALPENSPALHQTLYFNARFVEQRVECSQTPEYKRHR